jgi:hypothetical protein
LSYKVRNSIALGILLFLVLSGGGYWRIFDLPTKGDKIETEVKSIEQRLQDTPNLVNQFNDLSAEEALGESQ